MAPQDLTEITFDEIYSMKFVYRAFGEVGDMVIEVRAGQRPSCAGGRPTRPFSQRGSHFPILVYF